MKIVCVGYRDWALEIYERLKVFYGNTHNIIIVNKEEYSEAFLEKEKPDMVLFYGWSWKIKTSVINIHLLCQNIGEALQFKIKSSMAKLYQQ